MRSAPTTVLAAAVNRVMVSDGMSETTRRVTRSRPEVKKTAARSRREAGAKPPVVGLRMISTPQKPKLIAVQRRQPTGSPRKRAAPSVTARGSDCMIDDTLAKSIRPSALMKVSVAPISKNVLSRIVGCRTTDNGRSAPS